jgi:protein-tyrosine-phosphatase
VCVQNSSRSQIAEALLRRQAAPGVEVYSAGINPSGQVNEKAIAVMEELGCDMSGHRSKHLSEFREETFDFVAKMDTPDLSDLVKSKWMENWDIPDPAQGGMDAVRRVRDLIAERVNVMDYVKPLKAARAA